MITFRDATAADLRAFYGEVKRCRAIVAVRDGQVIGVGGYRVHNGQAVLFSDVRDEAIRRYPVTLVRLGRALVNEASAKGIRLASVVQPAVPRARAFLQRIGLTEAA